MSESAPGQEGELERERGTEPSGTVFGWNRDAGLSVFGMRTTVGPSGILQLRM